MSTSGPNDLPIVVAVDTTNSIPMLGRLTDVAVKLDEAVISTGESVAVLGEELGVMSEEAVVAAANLAKVEAAGVSAGTGLKDTAVGATNADAALTTMTDRAMAAETKVMA